MREARRRSLAAALVFGTIACLFTGAAGAEPEASSVDAFDASAEAGLLSLVAEEERDGLASALEDAGRNWSELAGAVETLKGEEREACVWLVGIMPHLDRLEMTSATLVEHVRYAFRTLEEMPYEVPESMFRDYILAYRIESEPVDAWRRELFEIYAPVAERHGETSSTARAVSGDLARRVSRLDRGFFGPRQSPALTLRSGHGTDTEIAVLLCAALKAVGIPSRHANVPWLGAEKGGASWVEFYDGVSWTPIYMSDPNAMGDFGHIESNNRGNVTIVETRSAFDRVLATERYTETATLRVLLTRGGEPASNHEHLAVCVFNDGALAPLDGLAAVTDTGGRFDALVGDGRYVVVAGERDGLGNPSVFMREITAAPGETVTVAIDLDEEAAESVYAAAAPILKEPPVEAVVLLDLDEEPSVRMLPLLVEAFARRRAAVATRWWYVGGDDERIAEAGSRIGAEDVLERSPLEADDAAAPPGIGEIPPVERGSGRAPLVVLYAKSDGRVILHREGYDLSIAGAIIEAVDGTLAETPATAGVQTTGERQ